MNRLLTETCNSNEDRLILFALLVFQDFPTRPQHSEQTSVECATSSGPRSHKGGSDGAEIFQMLHPGADWCFEVREYNICCGARGLSLPGLGSNCYIVLTERRKKQGQESLSYLKCVEPQRRATSGQREETDVWTFAVKLSQRLCQSKTERSHKNFTQTFCHI